MEKIATIPIALCIVSLGMLSGCLQDIVIPPTTIHLTVYDNHTPIEDDFEEITGAPSTVFVYEYIYERGRYGEFCPYTEDYIVLTKTDSDTYEGNITVHLTDGGKTWVIGFPSSNYINQRSVKTIILHIENEITLYHWNYTGVAVP